MYTKQHKRIIDKEKGFHCIKIDTKEELIEFIQKQKAYKHPNTVIPIGGKIMTYDEFFKKRNHYIIYRGIKESKYPLNTSLQFRWKEIKHFHPSFSQIKYLTRMVELLENNPTIKHYFEKDGKTPTDISILALMQHYGLPTPLLDWTPDIETGLNFAYDGIDLNHTDDEITNYASLYYINLDKNYELLESSYQKIINYKGFLEEELAIINQHYQGKVDFHGACLKELFTVNDLGLDFIYIDYSNDAPYVQDIFGNVLTLINPNLEKQEGAFIINFHRANLDFYWNKKQSNKGTKIIREHTTIHERLGEITFTCSENPNAIGILPMTKIGCANIKKSVLDDWINNGGKNDHYDDSEESKLLKVSTLKTYFTWLLSRKKDYDYFKKVFIKEGKNDDQRIAKEFLESYKK